MAAQTARPASPRSNARWMPVVFGSQAHAQPDGHAHQQHAGPKAGEKHFFNGHAGAGGVGTGDDGEKNQRERRREQQPQAARTGEHSQGGTFGITRAHQHRQEQSAQRENGHARRAGEGGEKRARQDGDDGRAAAELPQQRLENPDQPFGGAAFREKIAGQREQRERRQRGVGHHRIVRQRNRGDGHIFAPK